MTDQITLDRMTSYNPLLNEIIFHLNDEQAFKSTLNLKSFVNSTFKSSVGLKALSPFSEKVFSLIQSKLIWLYYWHPLFVVAVNNMSLRFSIRFG